MILILVDKITKRQEYTFHFIFQEHGIEFKLTENTQEFNDFDGIKLNYSLQKADSKFIRPSGLLLEDEIRDIQVNRGTFNKLDCLEIYDIHDPIASVFYILTRYEEYFSVDFDSHGRFQLKNSVLKKYNWNRLAICDRWTENIYEFLGVTFQSNNDVNIIPTFDIDNTYAYKLKTRKLFWLALAKDLSGLKLSRIKERFDVLGGGNDPYDTFDQIAEIAKEFDQTKVFWLVADRGEKDRNIPVQIKEHKDLINKMNKVTSVNLHPGYGTKGMSNAIAKEKERLEEILEEKTNNVRMHFLRFKLPETYQSLIKCGFTHEYSMGFAEDAGFRSGTARAHKWFDLILNRETDFIIHPFVYMDGTLNEYLGLSIEESKVVINALYQEVKKYGGDYVFLWHNETIGNYGIWKGWEDVLEYTLKLNKHES